MQEEIDKLGQVIDALRERASDPEMRDFLLDWLEDPAVDSYPVEKLLTYRSMLVALNDIRNGLIMIHEDQVYEQGTEESI